MVFFTKFKLIVSHYKFSTVLGTSNDKIEGETKPVLSKARAERVEVAQAFHLQHWNPANSFTMRYK